MPAATSSRSSRNTATPSGPRTTLAWERGQEQVVGRALLHPDAHARAVDVRRGAQRGVVGDGEDALDHDVRRGEATVALRAGSTARKHRSASPRFIDS